MALTEMNGKRIDGNPQQILNEVTREIFRAEGLADFPTGENPIVRASKQTLRQELAAAAAAVLHDNPTRTIRRQLLNGTTNNG